jgi:hypothetical protein
MPPSGWPANSKMVDTLTRLVPRVQPLRVAAEIVNLEPPGEARITLWGERNGIDHVMKEMKSAIRLANTDSESMVTMTVEHDSTCPDPAPPASDVTGSPSDPGG